MQISKNTLVTVMLRCRMADAQAPVLGHDEYNALARRLKEAKATPADLAAPDAGDLAAKVAGDLGTSRLHNLLARGLGAALVVDGWMRQAISVLGRSDADYPEAVRRKLGANAPSLLFAVGSKALLDGGGLALVGSPGSWDVANAAAHAIARAAGEAGLTVLAQAAEGVGVSALRGAAEARGLAVCVAPGSIAPMVRAKSVRDGVAARRLALVSPAEPSERAVPDPLAAYRVALALADAAVLAVGEPGDAALATAAAECLKKGGTNLSVLAGGALPGGLAGLAGGGAARLEVSDPDLCKHAIAPALAARSPLPQ